MGWSCVFDSAQGAVAQSRRTHLLSGVGVRPPGGGGGASLKCFVVWLVCELRGRAVYAERCSD